MNWTAYKIVLHLQTPMHMGRAKMGNLQITRPYVHGKALWGALTARITRESTLARSRDYRDVGNKVNEQLAFSYFYPTIGENVSLWPWDDPERFAWQFLGSYASTALDYSQNSAADGSLHETEFIAPHTRYNQPVNLVGYIFERDDCTLPWRDALSKLQIGGERTYGWGRVRLGGSQEVGPGEKLFGFYSLHLSGQRPALSLGKDAVVLLAHTRAVDPGAVQAEGRVVPLVGRETKDASAHGRDVVMRAVCWEPGARGKEKTSVAILDNGLWAAAP